MTILLEEKRSELVQARFVILTGIESQLYNNKTDGYLQRLFDGQLPLEKHAWLILVIVWRYEIALFRKS